MNTGAADVELIIPVGGRLPDGAVLVDLVDGTAVAVANGALALPLSARTARVLVAAPDQDLEAPGAPGGLSAAATPGRVALTWEPAVDAAGYRVWRSLLSGGGYAPVADVTDAAFVDRAVRDGAAVHYVVTALDAAGNVSARSEEAPPARKNSPALGMMHSPVISWMAHGSWHTLPR